MAAERVNWHEYPLKESLSLAFLFSGPDKVYLGVDESDIGRLS